MAKIYKDSATWSAGLSHDTASWSEALVTSTGAASPVPVSSGTGLRGHYDLGTGDDLRPTISISGTGQINVIHAATGNIVAHPVVAGAATLRRIATAAVVSHPAVSGTAFNSGGGAGTKTGTGALVARPTVSGAVGTLRHFGTGAMSPVIRVTNTPGIPVFPVSGIPPGKGASNVDGDEALRLRIDLFFREKNLRRLDEEVKDAMEALLKIL